jgi:hypothetical protein
MSTREAFNIKVTESYIKAYLHEFYGTIATGLSSGIEYFSYLCPTFPLHHLPLWRQIYLQLGCLRFIRNVDQEEILVVRESPEFHNFVRRIRFLIHKEVSSARATSDFDASNVTCFLSRLKIILSNSIVSSLSSPKDVDDFLKVIESVSINIDFDYCVSQPNAPRYEQDKDLFVRHNPDHSFDYLLTYIKNSTLQSIQTSRDYQKELGITIIQELKVTMGDTFENVGKDTTIINRSSLQDVSTQVRHEHNQVASEALGD